jgi:hypothetical protein
VVTTAVDWKLFQQLMDKYGLSLPKQLNYTPFEWVWNRDSRFFGWSDLGIQSYINTMQFKAIQNHTKVIDYLESHPDIQQKYKADQTGEVKYFDVLDLAEAEIRRDLDNLLKETNNHAENQTDEQDPLD